MIISDICVIVAVLKDSSNLSNLKFEYVLPFNELGLEVDSPQCRTMGEKLRKFYFGYTPLNTDSLSVYSMVISFISHQFYIIQYF